MMEADRLMAAFSGADPGLPGPGSSAPLGGYGKALDDCGGGAAGGGGGGGSGGVSNEPFYLLREPVASELTGSSNLLCHYNLDAAFAKFCGKKVKEKLSNFLPDLPGMIDTPALQDGSSLRAVMEKPPLCGKELHCLPSALMTGFRLHAGPLPDQYRLLHQMPLRKKHKQKQKHRRPDTMSHDGKELASDSDPKKKKKKREDDPERRRRKKDKKKKKNRHSPEHPSAPLSSS
ncbi:mediator of RNA polymerase II transcription subunit 19 isoform X3 [Petromyzon marinus]|nr:mediator of RNA polymerase II transcription subunit 19 isoform X3 [Petromyzon marinus]